MRRDQRSICDMTNVPYGIHAQRPICNTCLRVPHVARRDEHVPTRRRCWRTLGATTESNASSTSRVTPTPFPSTSTT
eukprot:2657375-Rhodomonas_salina.2